MDDVSYTSTREKIVRTTLDLIQKDGFQNVTVRKIAGSANVNIASINYHFGSKDAVINEALKHVTNELMHCFNILEAKELDPITRLRRFLQDYSDVINKYPDIIKNFISLIMNSSDVQIPFREFLKDSGFRLIKGAIHDIRPDEEDAVSDMRTIQLISSTGYPILLGAHLKEISGFDYNSQEQRYKYIELILKSVIK